MAAWREQGYAQPTENIGRRIPRQGSALCKHFGVWPREPATAVSPVTSLFRNRAGTLALILALSLALWAAVLAVLGAMWGLF